MVTLYHPQVSYIKRLFSALLRKNFVAQLTSSSTQQHINETALSLSLILVRTHKNLFTPCTERRNVHTLANHKLIIFLRGRETKKREKQIPIHSRLETNGIWPHPIVCFVYLCCVKMIRVLFNESFVHNMFIVSYARLTSDMLTTPVQINAYELLHELMYCKNCVLTIYFYSH